MFWNQHCIFAYLFSTDFRLTTFRPLPCFDQCLTLGGPSNTERWTVLHHNRIQPDRRRTTPRERMELAASPVHWQPGSRPWGHRPNSSADVKRWQPIFFARLHNFWAKPKIWRGFNQVWGNVSMNFNTTRFCPFMRSCRCARQARPENYTLDLKLYLVMIWMKWTKNHRVSSYAR